MQSDKLKAERVEALRQSLKTAARLSFHESTHKENNRDIDALCDAYLTRPVPDPEQQEAALVQQAVEKFLDDVYTLHPDVKRKDQVILDLVDRAAHLLNELAALAILAAHQEGKP